MNQKGFLATLAQHKVAANVLMLLMFLSGFFALKQLNRQFFPTFNLDVISVRINWQSANSEDIERSITIPVEKALRNVNSLNKMTSSSVLGGSFITLEFTEGTDMPQALEQVKQLVSEVRNLPSDSETAVINRVTRYENVGRILLSSKSLGLDELRVYAYRIEDYLLKEGVDRVNFVGLPNLQMIIRLDNQQLENYDLTISDIARSVAASSRDIPLGSLGGNDSERDLRVLAQGRSIDDFSSIVIRSRLDKLITLGDIATIHREPIKNQPLLYVDNNNAIEMIVQRQEGGDTLETSKIIQEWEAQETAALASQVQIKVFDKRWKSLEDRIGVLLENGISGMVLVVLLLYLFMHGRVAIWVAIGIPASYSLALLVLYLIGGSINMLTSFALIMCLGIIVDDAIVVSEEALQNFEKGMDARKSVLLSIEKMFPPILASSLTTVAAFLPLTFIGGTFGQILIALPIVTICVIAASLIESFLVLPGHLNHSFSKIKSINNKVFFRERFENGFYAVRDNMFIPLLKICLSNRLSVLVISFGALILSLGMLTSGLLKFEFFPSPEGRKVYMQAKFAAGTSSGKVQDYLVVANEALNKTLDELGEDIVSVRVQRVGLGAGSNAIQASNYGSIFVELIESDLRKTRNETFLQTWRRHLPEWSGLIDVTMSQRRVGPPGKDLSIRLIGDDVIQVKKAAEELIIVLQNIAGIENVFDDLPYGKDQLLFELTPQAVSLGVTVGDLSAQIRSAFSSQLVQIYNEGNDDIEVRISLLEDQTDNLATLENINVALPNGGSAPLANLVNWKSNNGFQSIRHFDARAAVEVQADIDKKITSFDDVRTLLVNEKLSAIVSKNNVQWAFSGKALEQGETFADMKVGGLLGLALIYIILAWIFSSWGWPVLVMAIIPMGLIGAVLGHWAMDINLTILSIFGLFGLSGIVINDSIILVSAYRKIRDAGAHYKDALVEAVRIRFRAVLLTSLTTIGGLIFGNLCSLTSYLSPKIHADVKEWNAS